MSLKKSKIVSNTKKYVETAKEYGFLTPELEDFLGSDFIEAPASTLVKLHNAFEGGLIDHTLRVMKHGYLINKNNLIDELKIDEVSLFKIILLHSIGKAKLYIPETSDWHRENQGKMYKFNEDLISMRVGERSGYYALSNGVELTEEEYASIINFDKSGDTQSEWYNTTAGDVLKMAVKLAIMEEKKIAERNQD
jgi:hypothetical protein